MSRRLLAALTSGALLLPMTIAVASSAAGTSPAPPATQDPTIPENLFIDQLTEGSEQTLTATVAPAEATGTVVFTEGVTGNGEVIAKASVHTFENSGLAWVRPPRLAPQEFTT